MPSVNRQQFWKANPNQMALPGMEAQAHPAAMHVAQGFHFKSSQTNSGQHVMMTAHHSDWGDQSVAEMDWRTKRDHPTFGDRGTYHHPAGEITWVNAHPDYRGGGLATAMYGVGRTMARVKPRHSNDRTDDGDVWAPKSAARHGGPVPRNVNKQKLRTVGDLW